MSAEEANGNGSAAEGGGVQQVSELLDRLVLGSKDDPAELGYTVAVTGIAALEQVRCADSSHACSTRSMFRPPASPHASAMHPLLPQRQLWNMATA